MHTVRSPFEGSGHPGYMQVVPGAVTRLRWCLQRPWGPTPLSSTGGFSAHHTPAPLMSWCLQGLTCAVYDVASDREHHCGFLKNGWETSQFSCGYFRNCLGGGLIPRIPAQQNKFKNWLVTCSGNFRVCHRGTSCSSKKKPRGTVRQRPVCSSNPALCQACFVHAVHLVFVLPTAPLRQSPCLHLAEEATEVEPCTLACGCRSVSLVQSS